MLLNLEHGSFLLIEVLLSYAHCTVTLFCQSPFGQCSYKKPNTHINTKINTKLHLC